MATQAKCLITCSTVSSPGVREENPVDVSRRYLAKKNIFRMSPGGQFLCFRYPAKRVAYRVQRAGEDRSSTLFSL
jgi:hypothetical protein